MRSAPDGAASYNTLLTPIGATPFKVKVALDTHSVALRTADGKEVGPTVEATLVFAAAPAGVAERAFVWESAGR